MAVDPSQGLTLPLLLLAVEPVGELGALNGSDMFGVKLICIEQIFKT